jgi:exodeoxyribonuclease V gamma subunit
VPPPPESDRSIEFHVAHSVQREVEILHDQLLAMFAADPQLRPRDVVVMVPDIDVFTASIRAVFGQHRRHDARFIPHEIGDVNDRSVNPLLVALEWLLRLPQQRCRQSEVRDLLDVPALARRFGLAEDDLPTLGQWIEGAGVRWGLDAAHRAGLGLAPAGEQNAWMFGVRRMLLGYAAGNGAAFAGIEPYAEVGGLDAALAGSLAQLIEALLAWRERLGAARRPAEWAEQARLLLAGFFSDRDEADRLTLARLDDALDKWLETCEDAGFDEAVPLATLREAWLGGLDEPSLEHQFVSGGVTFCTLMPMRAVPFRVVCLLGMNDGDFPRRASRADFDLLALPGMARPGDRSRRDDDRYLMLEALLAARTKLYISWVGRNVRDNSEQPPSVLVAQLRDYLQAGWQLDLGRRTTWHALQPFSRAYFERGGLLTFAGEWRAAHDDAAQPAAEAPLPPYEVEEGFRLRLSTLAAFLRQPVRHFFRQRLGVYFGEAAVVGEDEEPFQLDGLQRYTLEDLMLADGGEPEALEDVRAGLQQRGLRLRRQGMLPIGLIGERVLDELVEELVPVRTAWLTLCGTYWEAAPKLAIHLELAGLVLEDWVDQLRRAGEATAWLVQMSSRVCDKSGAPRGEKLIPMWLRQLAAAAQGQPVTGFLVARDAIVIMEPLEAQGAQATLRTLVELWRAGMDQPLPAACKTGLALVMDGDARSAYDGGFELSGENEDPCLARLWPDFAALSSEPGFAQSCRALYQPLAQWLQHSVTVQPIDGEGEP